jgi:DNA-binding NarL/FixJ family response regulator
VIRPAQPIRIRLVLAEGQPVSLVGLVAVFSADSSFAVLEHCGTELETVRAVINHRPDVVLLGHDIPPTGAEAVVRTLRSRVVGTRLILLVDDPNRDRVEWAQQLGVAGIVCKTMDPRVIINRVKDILDGKYDLGGSSIRDAPRPVNSPSEARILTPRQLEVARAAASGLSNKELATRFSVSEGTIKNHLHAIYVRLEVDGRIPLLLYLRAHAMVSEPGSASVGTPKRSTSNSPERSGRVKRRGRSSRRGLR